MKIVYYPFENESNKFIEISKFILKKCDCEIVDFNKVFNKHFSLLKNYDAVILNWYDSVWGHFNVAAMKFEIAKRKRKIILAKIFGLKIVFTFHNRLPHNTSVNQEKLLKRYAKWICKKSDYIIVLSNSSKEFLKSYLSDKEIEKKTRYVPHPNYILSFENRNL